MIDLTTISVPFGELDAETQERLREHERLGGELLWVFDGVPSEKGWVSIFDHHIYRAKSHVIPASVDWSHIHPDYNHIRLQQLGKWLTLFSGEPVFEFYGHDTSSWYLSDRDKHKRFDINIEDGCILASFRRGNMPWDSIILDRPKGE